MTVPPAAPKEEVRFREDAAIKGLAFTLRDARPASDASSRPKVAEWAELTTEETSALLARGPVFDLKDGDRQPFALRKASPPPPITGEDVMMPFPPPPMGPPPVVEAGPLEVRRHAPDGDVPMAPSFSVTFSQPMVAITSQEQASKTVPITLLPQPPGNWRWLGTKTLQFDPQPVAGGTGNRLPMATEYTVTVPKGTTSTIGGASTDAQTFVFRTPPVTLQSSWPSYGPHALSPVIRLDFDQAIQADAMLAKVHLRGPKGDAPLRLATDADLKGDEQLGQHWERNEETPERELFLVPSEPLARESSYTIVVDKGAPSAEGPRVTESEQNGSFFTYAPLKVTDHRCYGWDQCPPSSGFYIEFDNPLDAEKFDPATIKVEPEVPGLRIDLYGQTIGFHGDLVGRTKYTVTLPAGLTDKFAQTLGKDETYSFDVGPAESTLTGPGEFVVLDPEAMGSFSVWSTNHANLRVRIAKVGAEDWDDWTRFLQKYNWDNSTPGKMPGAIVKDATTKVAGDADRKVETKIDLGPYLTGEHGMFAVMIEPTVQPKERWYQQRVFAWIQVTDLGLTAFADGRDLTVWSTVLGSGDNAADVAFSVYPDGGKGQSGIDGLGKIAITDRTVYDQPQVLVAKKGDDLAILPRNTSWWDSSGGWYKVSDLDELRWYVVDDRGMYRPGEEVHVKGWLRRIGAGPKGDVKGLGDSPTKLQWTLWSSMRNELAKGEATVTPLGGFDLGLTIPADANLGQASLEFSALDGAAVTSTWHSHPVQIQEFRRPEFEVGVTAAEGPHLLGTESTVTVAATYYAGGGLPNADVNWYVTASPGSYTPPNHDGWQFGTFNAWWGGWWGSPAQVTSQSFSAKTDAAGTNTLGIHFDAMTPPRPYSVMAQASVIDVNRQQWTSSQTLLVHPSDVYVGLKTSRAFVEKGETIDIGVLATDIDGKDADGTSVELTFARAEWKWAKGQYSEEYLDPETCAVTTSSTSSCAFKPKISGSYRALAVVKDALGRKNESEVRVWVAGEDVVPSRSVEQQQVTVIPERQDYAPGDVAKVLVMAPFVPAEGVMTVRRSGLVRTERFRLDAASKTFEIPVEESSVPGFTVAFDLVGRSTRVDDQGKPREDLPKQIAYASGEITYKVSTKTRTLTVSAVPQKAVVMPGGETSIDVVVTDSAGRPVADAEVALVVADEAVLALSGYQLPDPIELFYMARDPGVEAAHLRSYVRLANPLALSPQGAAAGSGGMPGDIGGLSDVTTAMPMAAPAPVVAESPSPDMPKLMAGAKEERAEKSLEPMKKNREGALGIAGNTGTTAIAMRSDFSALALFAPAVRTDSQGKATVPLKVPDSLTRYRIMAVAAAGEKQFGKGESTITARLPLMVRPSPPRFLNFGDQAEIPVVLQNQTDAPLTVDLAVRGTNVAFTDAITDVMPDLPDLDVSSRGRRVVIAANDRVEVRFPASTRMAGTARFQAVAAAGDSTDAAEFSFPVWTPATTEAFATYGEIDEGSIKQPVEAPPDVWPQFGALDVQTSSTQLQSLTDAVLYLNQYPFDCNEQIASRLMGIAALRDVLSAFESPDLPPPAVLEKTVDTDLAKLASRQNWDGGFAFWRRGDESWPYLGIHVAHAEAEAKAKGYAVPSDMWERSLSYNRNIEQYLPYWYDQHTKWFLRAYALYTRDAMGDNDVNEARRLFKEAGTAGLGVDALGFLLPVLHAGGATTERDAILHFLDNQIAETAGEAHFVTNYSDGDQVLLHSDRRADGILLESLIDVRPDSDLIPKITRGLLAHRTKGHWSNTQDNVFVLLALDAYFHKYENQTPDFVARVWLGPDYAGDHTFEGRTTERAHVNVPMAYLTEHKGPQDLVVQRDGDAGRLYYRVGLTYAPKDLHLAPADYGFAVERRYEAIGDPSDVTQDADGTWHIKLGAQVRVRATMVAESRRYHVALVDPLPGGLEAQNPELATTGVLPTSSSPNEKMGFWWWERTWYEHQNLRDDRTEAFTSLLWDGVYDHTVVALATTPGRFVVPPAKAEEMYAPETFGRSGTDIVVIR